MSGEGKRSDGLLGESGNERRRSHLAPPVLYATALLFDSTQPLFAWDCQNCAGRARDDTPGDAPDRMPGKTSGAVGADD